MVETSTVQPCKRAMDYAHTSNSYTKSYLAAFLLNIEQTGIPYTSFIIMNVVITHY